MKDLPSDMSVTQISIPGTHNSHAIKSNIVVERNANMNFASYALYNPGIVVMYSEVYTAIATCQRFSMWDQPIISFLTREYRTRKKGRYGVVVTDFCNQIIASLFYEQNFGR
ncbi:hypothetical protein HZ326_14825 [Fusarium oxysporum f. sp. albedinis]|nr:hypothetical protein HZ326_14825 [Fusarium oxysporum f. sp. albedinis]